MKADDPHPKERLTKIEELLNANNEAAELQAKYDEFIRIADEAFGTERWEASKSAYQSAISLKDEQYPKDQIDKINAKPVSYTHLTLPTKA